MLILLFIQKAEAQVTDPFPYKFSSSIYEKIKTDSASWRGGVTSSDLSFIGLYKEALQEWDKPRQARRKISETDSINFIKNYRAADARKFILKKARENRVLIFNEAHYNPRNRVFVNSLLKDLKKIGYRYFAAETFSMRPGFGENSKYPNLNTGYYAMEPQFGNLIRTANELNFTLYPYEHIANGNQWERETGQARNLARLLDSIPDSKVIVYCGFDHIMEDSIANWVTPMAARLRELTGIDPYTVDQIVLAERSSPSLNNPYFNLITAKSYAILADNQNNAFNKRSDNKKVDALLFSPPTRYIYNRPHWVFENGKTAYILDKDSVKVTYPFLAKIYFTEEDIDNMVIPVDIIEIRNETELSYTAMAVFRKRKFIMQLIDTKGATQLIYPDWRRKPVTVPAI
ncbi:MAG: hypothetical protein QM781_17040 [Chitinophagaceae bacterium]